ncbi:FtsX-like permease family protein [Bacillus sp. 3103sda1]|uniref:FtsX-like permease family protein n=1 Tax=Bacillus sp. 3103sda1 TaxID=2953808 RepID=UPI00209E1346|nr:FtsX-like permease family protein [Bacillus sp. 3103sda1]MCP1124503.1 FtsX-like permease family protein [Bacillus sp. 3103sda1]
MSLFQLAKKSIQAHAAERLQHFVFIACSVIVYFLLVSIQYNEAVVGAIKHKSFLYYGSTIAFSFSCLFILYVHARFMKNRQKELQSYRFTGMKRRQISLILCYEQLMIGGGALVFGLLHGMLFLKLFTVIIMRLTGSHGISSAPITIYGLLYTAILFIIMILLTAGQCYRCVYQLTVVDSYNVNDKV